MQQPSTAAGAPHTDTDTDTADAASAEARSEVAELGPADSADGEPSGEDIDIDLDQDLRSLVDGIAMLGRFESELAEFESSLEDVSARGG